jgi:predicted RNA-binding Zn ribbon-like protein
MTSMNGMMVTHARQTEAVDERDKRRVGEQIEPGGRPKAPGRLELLQRFVNTWNHEFPSEWDRLGTATKAAAWLRQKGLVSPSAPVTAAEAGRLRRLREALRVLARGNATTIARAHAIAAIRRESSAATLLVGVDDRGRTSLEPAVGGVDAAVAILLGIWHEARLEGSWPRLKACRQCEYVFYDRSKNRSAAWCAMSICGNRTKNRAYRARRAVRRSTRRSS